MYRITSVRLHNICQHADLNVKVESGLTGILAPNGTGKTNLCRGLVYGLTGLVDGLWGNQQTLQKDGTADIGFVHVEFTDGKHEYSIRRFSTSSAKFPDVLTKDGKEWCKRRALVDSAMKDVFGMSCKLMFQVCWGRQGELAQLLMSPPAIISDFLGKVFDMKHLETVRSRIKDAIDTIPVPSPECRSQLESDRKALASLPDIKELEEALELVEGQLKARNDELIKMKISMATGITESQHAERLQQSRDLVKTLESQEADLRAVAGDFESDKTREEADAAYSALLDRRNETAELLRDVSAQQSRTEAEIAGLKAKQDALDSERDVILKCVSSPGKSCPLCGHEIDDWESFSSRAIQGVSSYKSFAEYDKYYNEQMAAVNAARKRLVDDLEKITANVSALEELNAAADAQLASRKVEVAWYMLQDCLSSLERARSTLALVESEAVRPDGVGREVSSVELEVRDLQATCDSTKALIADTKARKTLLEDYVKRDEESLAEYEKVGSVLEALNAIRDALSAGRAQARYIKARVRALNSILAKYMAYTELPFNVWLDPERRMFLYRTPAGYAHPAVHLSGAQRAMVSVALQMALYDVMRPNMCLYIIDEPTEPLDDGNKEIMACMFDRMNRMVASAGGTMLIVTRDQPLIDCCNNILELKNG